MATVWMSSSGSAVKEESMQMRTIERVCDNLTDTITDRVRSRTNGLIKDLEVCVREGVITLHGRAARFYHKQLATSAVQELDHDLELENLICVKPH